MAAEVTASTTAMGLWRLANVVIPASIRYVDNPVNFTSTLSMQDYNDFASSLSTNSTNASDYRQPEAAASDSINPMDEMYPDLTQIPAVFFLFIILYFVVMVLALSGNFMVCYVVFSNRKMHTVVNYYIVNLAVCDFMVGAFVLPVKLVEMAAPAEWSALNDQICTAMAYLQTIFVFASVLTLVATCLERYVAILHPLESRMYQSKKRAKRILLVIWLIPCLAALPFVIFKSVAAEDNLSSDYGTIHRISCYPNFSDKFRVGYYTFLFIFFYLIPLTFIGGTCFRIARCLVRGISFQRQGSVRRQEANRRKVAKMIMVVVVAFAVSWTPYFLVTMITQYHSNNYFERHNFFFTMMVINLFGFINSCVNPFIYAAMSSRFRNGFKRFLRIVTCTLDPQKHPISKIKKPRVVGRFSCSYNRQMLLYANDYSQNNSEGSASQSDSGSLQQSTAAVRVESVRSLRSLVSCLSLKKKMMSSSSNTDSSGKPNGVCLVGNGKYVFSELATIPGSPVGGIGLVEKKLKESGLLDQELLSSKDSGTATTTNTTTIAEESFTTSTVNHIPQGVNEEVRSQDRDSLSLYPNDEGRITRDAKPRSTSSQCSLSTLTVRRDSLTLGDTSHGSDCKVDIFEGKAYFDADDKDSVILVPPESVALMGEHNFDKHRVRRHSIERTIHLLEFRRSSDKRVHRSASAPSSLLQSALKAILPSSEVRIDNL